MLDLLRRRDHQRIARRLVVGVAHHLLRFFDQAFHPFAFLAARRDPELIEHLLETFDVLLGLLQVLLERLPQILARRFLRHLRKRLGELLLGVVHVLQLVLQQFVERFETGHALCLP